MTRQAFTFDDIATECRVEYDCYRLDGRSLGVRVHVPPALYGRYPYSASAYAFLQELRAAIFEYGTLEFPGLPLNPSNHTVAMRHPLEHSYSDNPYLNRFCQEPHQDTPPYPTAFWLDAPRRFAATWVMSRQGLAAWHELSAAHPDWDTEHLHRELVPRTLAEGSALLFTRQPGLFLFDNSEHHRLFHARTCMFDAVAADPEAQVDAPAYAFNEVGLLNYIDVLDSRRGSADRDAAEVAEVRQFLAREKR